MGACAAGGEAVSDRWIWIPHWDGPEGFQHYKGRDPIWIKNYTRLLSKSEYMDLTLPQRGLLHGIWLAYAVSSRKLPGNTLVLSRRLGCQVKQRSLQSLAEAGFIQFLDSNTLATRLQAASPEKRREDKELGLDESGVRRRPVHVWTDADQAPDLSYITGGRT